LKEDDWFTTGRSICDLRLYEGEGLPIPFAQFISFPYISSNHTHTEFHLLLKKLFQNQPNPAPDTPSRNKQCVDPLEI
jgi:hypothetical protein